MEFIKEDLNTAKQVMMYPYHFIEDEVGYYGITQTIRYYITLTIILSLLTPIINIAGFPSDVIHASTNAQMAAFKYSPFMEQLLGVSRHFWTGILTVFFMVVKLPFFVTFYHFFAKLMGGKGDFSDSLRLTVYPATPALLLGWVPYSDFIFGLWVAFFLVPGFRYLHDVSWGKSVAFVTFMIGLQILYVVLSQGGWLIEP